MSLAEKLAAERRGRLAAERLLELKQAELYAANRKLGLHARALSEEIVETRAEVASVRDENRRVKSDLSVAHQNLEIAERRLWHSIQTIQDGFAFFDADDRLIAANDAYMVIFDGLEDVKPGIAFAQILQLLTEEGIVDTGDQTAAEWRAAMLRRRQLAEPEPVTIRLWNDQYVKMVDHRSPSGDLVSLGLNITATVRYERDLKEARERAEAAARAKSAFLANMSHEIRTPMNGVVGMAELLLEAGLNEEQQLYAETIRNSGEALLVIINDVLDYSKIEAQKMVLHCAPFDLEKSIHEVLMLLQPAAREKNVSLILDYDLFLPNRFSGDVGRIRQILTNLIGNAVKFTPSGHVLVRVTGAPRPDSAKLSVHIAIEDTGIGIAEDKIDQIFGEFTQVEDERNRKFEGTGLGLAISKRLVELMEGEIWASSEAGVGSCFGFLVPLDVSEDAQEIPSSLHQTVRKVMLVDGNRTDREILYKQLELLQIETCALATGADALQEIDASFDLLIIDEKLPDMEGTDLVRRMRAAGRDAPVILLTAQPQSAMAPDSEIASILTRPLSRDRLFGTLRDLGTTMPTGIEPPEGTTSTSVAPTVRAVSGSPDEPDTTADQTVASPAACDGSGESQAAPVPMFRARQRRPESGQIPTRQEPQADGSPSNGQTSEAKPDSAAPRLGRGLELTTMEPGAARPDASAAGPLPTVARKMRILAAEDNKTNQLVFRKMVKDLDIELRIANNGVEALAAYQEFEPDMIFMDISMPQMDGKEATGEIRKLEAATGRHVPIVALTAHAMDGDDQGILAAGLDHYLTKPLRKPALFEVIRSLIPCEVADPFPADAA